ncbi:MAG: ABC transporter substrate-binding protein [Desulfarculus sp.]|nr:ABC transporter substrate-binding protein [Desulfarculus sp.]
MKRLALVLCLSLLAALVAAPQAGAAEPIKVGVLMEVTGPSAMYGQNGLKGLELAQANRPTVLGRPVSVVVADNKSDKVEASNAANRLIQHEKVAAILGPLTSGNSLAAAPVCEAASVPMISPWATNPMLTQGKQYAFRVCFIDPFQGQVGANFAVKNLKAKTAAIMVDIAQDYCVGITNFFEKAFKDLGGQVVIKTPYSSGDQEFGPQLMAIKAKNPDIIYVPAYVNEGALIARQARELGLKQPMLGGDASQADELIKIGGQAVEGLSFTTHFDENGVTTQSGQAFVKAYRAKYNEAPDSCSALTYDAYNVLLDAMEKAKSAEAKAFVPYLANTKDFPGVTGVLTLVAHDAVKPAVILQVKDGKFAFVATVNP